MATVATESKWNVTRSSLEEMLEAIRKRDEKPKDVPPALPVRPISKARLPSARRSLPNDFKIGEATPVPVVPADYLPNSAKESEGKKRDRGQEEDHLGSGGNINSNSNNNNNNKMFKVTPAESPYDALVEGDLERNTIGSITGNVCAALDKEFRVWCQLSNGQWKSGIIQSISAEDALVMLSDGSVVTVPLGNILPSNPDILDGVDDLVQLSYLNEPSIVHNINFRYCQDKIYTKAGPVLVAMNPFKDVHLQKHDSIKAYRQKIMEHPHVYAVADAAFSDMMRDKVNQSIIISGESGAGKTETARVAMQYLAALGGGSGIEHKMLQTNYILESFGNAKTSNNQNSSRFGKLLEIHFSIAGKICGAKIETFLLEKSRVVQLAKGERSYHIFYQLCSGAPSFLKEKLNLKAAGEYYYLKHGDCLTIDGVSDARKFQMLMEALNIVQICKEDQDNAFAMLAAILWLGNVSFQVIDSESHVEVMTDEAVTSAAKLMGCNIQDLVLVLSTRRVQGDDDTVVQKLTLPQAIEMRDALAISIYRGLFDWLVEKINMSLEVGKVKTVGSISIVDITGFEPIQRGCFEQFCRNYANERLEQHFNRHLFTLEQEEYRREGIEWTKVHFEDNQECLNLFEQKPFGLLSLLDEECSSLESTDLTFANKLKQHLSNNPCFNGEKDGTFSVRHYAGEVLYDPSGFLLNSRDHLYSDSVELLSSCTCQPLKLFASDMLKSSQKQAGLLLQLGSSDSQNQSVGSKLKDQLFKLMQQVEKTTPHFIRCIKPNTKQLPGNFEKDLVLQQLRYCGLLEVVRISRSAYPTRMTHKQFARRYNFCLSKDVASQSPLSVSMAILRHFNVHPDLYQVGYTKLFLRTGQIAALEDAKRLQSVIEIQKCFRGHQDRRRFLELKKIITAPHSGPEKSTMQQRAMRGFSDEQNAVVFLQSVIRGWLVRRNSNRNLVITKIGSTNTNNHPNLKDLEHNQAPLLDLQRRVMKAEVVVKQKEDENTTLKHQLKQFEMKWSEYEEKVKSMEEIWQKKIKFLEMSLDAAKSGLVADEAMAQPERPDASPLHHCYDSEDTMSPGNRTPELSTPVKLSSRSSDPTPGGGSNGLNAVCHLVKEFDQRKQAFNDDARFLVEIRSGQVPSNSDPYDELQKLRKNFEAWKKDFRVKLRDTKSSLHKLGITGSTKHRRTWWALMSSRRT